MNIIFISSLFHHGECSPHEVVDDDVRGPEELDHVGHHVDLAPAPVRAGVKEHPRIYFSGLFTLHKENKFKNRNIIKTKCKVKLLKNIYVLDK